MKDTITLGSFILGLIGVAFPATLFVLDCTSFSSCHLEGTSEVAFERASVASARAGLDLDWICERGDLKSFFSHSPCKSENFTGAHLSDPIPINAEDVARYHAAINAIIERYVVDMYRTSVPAVTSVGNLHIAWNLRRGRVYKDLIESRATWGEFNRARRILVLELALATRAVFAIQGQPGSASLVR